MEDQQPSVFDWIVGGYFLLGLIIFFSPPLFQFLIVFGLSF